MSVRQSIVTALDTRLKTILIANGYQTNLGNQVEAWRSRDLEKGEAYFLTYRDTTNPKTQEEVAIGTHEHALTLELEALVVGGTSAATGRKMISDLLKALGVDKTLGGVVPYGLSVDSDELVVDKGTKTFSEVKVVVTAPYSTPLWEN